MEKSCWYNHPSGSIKGFKSGGKCYGFISHTFETDDKIVAAAIVEDDVTGIISVVHAKDVCFTIPGNLDKR